MNTVGIDFEIQEARSIIIEILIQIPHLIGWFIK